MSGAVPELRFPGFVGEWEASTLGDITKISKGKGISKADIVEGGVTPCIRYGELYTTYGTVIDSVVSFTDIDARSLRMSSGGEVIIPASGETSEDIATAAVVLRPGIALGGDLNILATEQSGHFLASYISGPKRIALAGMAQGNSVVHLYPSQISTLEIALPTLAEQQKIADFLGAVDAKLDALRRKKSGLEAFKSGLMQRLFSQDLRFTRDDGTDFPDWEEAVIGDVLTLSQIPGSDGDVARKLSVQLWARGVRETGRSGSASTRYYVRRAGQFIYSKLDFLNCAFGIVPDGLHGLESTVDLPAFDISDSAVPGYLLNYVIRPEFYERYGSTADGSRKARRIQEDVFLSFPLMLPHPDEQRKIADVLTALDARSTVVADQITQMEAFKKGLLQQMFV